jgi:L-rhamnose-H+ transport protein
MAKELRGARGPSAVGADTAPPLLRNYLLYALAGTAWYFQFFFYTMGESQMGRYAFSSWTLHMASIIIFGTFRGLAFRMATVPDEHQAIGMDRGGRARCRDDRDWCG